MGLMNSISRWICDGRLDSTRATILTQIQRMKLKLGHDNVRLKRFREHPDDCRKLYNIGRKVRIQSLVVSIPACETLIKIGH
jgi:hypothetical protein